MNTLNILFTAPEMPIGRFGKSFTLYIGENHLSVNADHTAEEHKEQTEKYTEDDFSDLSLHLFLCVLLFVFHHIFRCRFSGDAKLGFDGLFGFLVHTTSPLQYIPMLILFYSTSHLLQNDYKKKIVTIL